jgi:hypothetical protein
MRGLVAFVLVLFYKIRRDFARFFGREQPARQRYQWKSGAARVEAGFSLVWRLRRALTAALSITPSPTSSQVIGLFGTRISLRTPHIGSCYYVPWQSGRQLA